MGEQINSFVFLCKGPDVHQLQGRVLVFNAFEDLSYVLLTGKPAENVFGLSWEF